MDYELFLKNFDEALVSCQKHRSELEMAKGPLNKDWTEQIIDKLLTAVEQMCRYARLLPSLGEPSPRQETAEQIIAKESGVSIEISPEGYPRFVLPRLLPRRIKDSKKYIRDAFMSAMNQHKDRKIKTTKQVIHVQSIYADRGNNRIWRDHDNLEAKVVIDVVAAHYLIDDSPQLLDHYYDARTGEMDKTIVTLIPYNEFASYIERQGMNNGID